MRNQIDHNKMVVPVEYKEMVPVCVNKLIARSSFRNTPEEDTCPCVDTRW